MSQPTGYMHPLYVQSLSEYGVPRALPLSGGWILERGIPGQAWRDATGAYPLFACPRWTNLAADLAAIDDLVSLTAVADPFGEYDPADLGRAFPDLVRPFKTHYVVDLTRGRAHISPHHLRNVRKAARHVSVYRCEHPPLAVDRWQALYAMLIARHAVRGVAAFSRHALQIQMSVPGLVAFEAVDAFDTVGMHLWFVHQQVAHYHLGACTGAGYDSGAAFALTMFAFDYFEERGVQWLNLGGTSGLADDAASGLARFKRGWATGTRTAYLCGRILNQARWRALVTRTGADYFPPYRQPPPATDGHASQGGAADPIPARQG